MKAVGYTETGPIDRPDALIDFEADKPAATGHDLLVKVEAISVNPVDTKIRSGVHQLEGHLTYWDGTASTE